MENGDLGLAIDVHRLPPSSPTQCMDRLMPWGLAQRAWPQRCEIETNRLRQFGTYATMTNTMIAELFSNLVVFFCAAFYALRA